MNPRQRRVKSTRPPRYPAIARLLLPSRLGRGDASLLDALPAPRSGTSAPCRDYAPSSPARDASAALREASRPKQSSAKCPQLLCPRPFPRSALARSDLDPTPSVRLLQPRATRDKPAPPPARATPETDEAAEVAAAPVFSPSPACAPRVAECLPCVSQSENQSQTLGGREPGEGRRGGGGGSSGGGVNPSGTQLAEWLQESGDGDDDDGRRRQGQESSNQLVTQCLRGAK